MFCMASVTYDLVPVHKFAMELFYHTQAVTVSFSICPASFQQQCNISAALVRTASVHRVVVPDSIQSHASCLAASHAVLAAAGQQHTLQGEKCCKD